MSLMRAVGRCLAPVLTAVCMVSICMVSMAVANSKDPRVPADRETGGIPVAIICTGVNYTLPEIAKRLARDGEGEIIGWDFADGDHRPFDTASGRAPVEHGGDGTALGSLLLAQSPDLRLSPVRFDPQSPASLGRALAFAGQTHTRVVLLAVSSARREDWDLFKRAAEHFQHLLIVVPEARGEATAFPASLGLDNVMVVPSKDVQAVSAVGFEGSPVTIAPEIAAAVRVAAKAATEAARDPNLDGAALRKLLQAE